MADVLSIDSLDKSFASSEGAVLVLRQISLSVARGESLALTGESGSGKSTLLHLAAGLETPDAGDVRVDGQSLRGLGDAGRAALRRDKIGLVFQQFNLIPSLTVAQNIAFPARLAGRADPEYATHLAERLGLGGMGDRYPETLSGGQQQRVAIARALTHRPVLILADEPTGNLDEATGDAVMDLFLELVAESSTTLVMVTHSQRLAGRLARHEHLSRGALAPIARVA